MARRPSETEHVRRQSQASYCQLQKGRWRTRWVGRIDGFLLRAGCRACEAYGNDDEGYFAAPVRMFEQAVTVAKTLPANTQDALIARLDEVSGISHSFGYGVGDYMDLVLAQYAKEQDLTRPTVP